MNKAVLFLVFYLSLILLSSCGSKYKNRILIADKIEYDVPIINYNLETDWWVQNIEGSKRDALIKKIVDGLTSGKLKAYNYTNDVLITDENLYKYINSGSADQLIAKSSKLRFLEKWFYNIKTHNIEKVVLSVCPVITTDSESIPLFCIKLDTNDLDKYKSKISERIQYDVTIKNEQQTTNDKQLNWWKDNLETSKREKLIDLIFESALSGKIKTYDYFNEIITLKNLQKSLYRVDTISSLRPNPPYDKVDTIIHRDTDKKMITRLRFMEEWYIGDESFSMTKVVKGINPILKVYDMSGDLKGYMPLFWLYFDKKYPVKKS